MNHLLLDKPHYQSGFVALTHQWNVNIFNQPNEGAIVAAWHGFGSIAERAESMREWANNHPYPSGPTDRTPCALLCPKDELTGEDTIRKTNIGIVIPVRNCLELTKAAVASLKTRHPFHLYFIDDHSSEDTKTWLSSVPNATIFTDPEHSTGVAWNWNLGISAALNDGMTHILIANNDIILHPDAIDAITRRVNVGDAVLVSGLPVNCGAPQDVLNIDVTDTGDGEKAEYSCFMITADTIRRVGWFDENYQGAYYEDTDYRAAIYHFGEREVSTHTAQYYHYNSSAIKEDSDLNEVIQERASQNHNRFISKWGRDWIDDVRAMNALCYPAPFNHPDSAVKKNEIPTARLADLYQDALRESSDISEHLNILYRMASTVDSVTSISADNTAISTAAFVYAMPKWCITYCKLQAPEIIRLRSASKFAGLNYIYEQYRSGIEIEPTDLLFLDSIKTEEVITRELNEYADKVRKYMIFHDTETFGSVGELPGSRGIWPAIAGFVRQHSEWRLFQHYSYCHGLTILERRD
jgi:GT2 family glycosyltransferase